MDSNTISKPIQSNSMPRKLLIIGVIVLIGFVATSLIIWRQEGKANPKPTPEVESKANVENEVAISTDAVATSGIEIVDVIERPVIETMHVTGAVEANQQQTQQATPLVSGRIEQIKVSLGDHVQRGTVIGLIASPEIAEIRGKYHDAEMRVEIAERKLERVQKTENRVAILQSQARLAEAEATLNRTKRLVALDMVAKKDLISAETIYNVAKAEYEFQLNIVSIRELQEAKAEVETSRADIAHVRDQLRALGAIVPEEGNEGHKGNTSLIPIVAPIAGVITERLVNVGAGVEANKPLFTIANLTNVWVVANVPEVQIGRLQLGTSAEIRTSVLGSTNLIGKISYIDPQLNEGTRTARVRIEVANPNERLKVGMFVEISFQTGLDATAKALFIPAEAVQNIDNRTVLFVPKPGESGHFEVREVEVGEEVDNYRQVIKGLIAGDRIVTKGSFILKTKLLKKQLEEE